MQSKKLFLSSIVIFGWLKLMNTAISRVSIMDLYAIASCGNLGGYNIQKETARKIKQLRI